MLAEKACAAGIGLRLDLPGHFRRVTLWLHNQTSKAAPKIAAKLIKHCHIGHRQFYGAGRVAGRESTAKDHAGTGEPSRDLPVREDRIDRPQGRLEVDQSMTINVIHARVTDIPGGVEDDVAGIDSGQLRPFGEDCGRERSDLRSGCTGAGELASFAIGCHGCVLTHRRDAAISHRPASVRVACKLELAHARIDCHHKKPALLIVCRGLDHEAGSSYSGVACAIDQKPAGFPVVSGHGIDEGPGGRADILGKRHVQERDAHLVCIVDDAVEIEANS